MPAKRVLDSLDCLGDDLEANLGSGGCVFQAFGGKALFVYFDAALERNRCYCRYRHARCSHLRPKVAPDQPTVDPKGQVRAARTVKFG